ncbi:MAG: lipoate--protein ligase family protein [Candidatus Eisenbacteria bacterium]|nr:lipoate--protein ligase family protein [Candidatus Eisenbacteria bacterium]
MAIDEALFRSVQEGRFEAAVRAYSWRAPTISVGYGQVMHEILNVEKCTALGIEIVRRPTGGGAVLHDEELTYSVAGSLKSSLFGGVRESQLKIALLLKRTLELLGLSAEIAAGPGRTVTAGGDSACFAAPSKCEITVDGKKIVGSAAAVRQGCFLQHGSILLGDSHLRLVEFLKEGGSSIRERSASASSLLGRKVSSEEVLSLFKAACSEILGQVLPAKDVASELALKATIRQPETSAERKLAKEDSPEP